MSQTSLGFEWVASSGLGKRTASGRKRLSEGRRIAVVGLTYCRPEGLLSDLGLFCNLECIVDLDAEVTDVGVAEQQLDRP